MIRNANLIKSGICIVLVCYSYPCFIMRMFDILWYLILFFGFMFLLSFSMKIPTK